MQNVKYISYDILIKMALHQYCLGAIGTWVLLIIISLLAYLGTFVFDKDGKYGAVILFLIVGVSIWQLLSTLYHYNTSGCTGWIASGELFENRYAANKAADNLAAHVKAEF